MQAAASGHGVVGEAVSKGEPHIVHGAGDAASDMGHKMDQRGRATRSNMRHKSEFVGEDVQERAQSMGNTTRQNADSMGDRAQRDTSEAYQRATRMGADAKANAAARTRHMNQSAQDRFDSANNVEVGGHVDGSTSTSVSGTD